MKKLGIKAVMAAALLMNSAAAFSFDFEFKESVFQTGKEPFAMNPDLSVSFETGTTGIGFGLESRLNEWFRVRTGFTWVPHFEFPMLFNIQIGDGKQYIDKDGRTRFDRMSDLLEEMTGFRIDQQVEMIGVPHFYNFNLLMDVYPFSNRKWYFTAGFYAGPSVIGRAYNRTEEMTTLITVAMYNNIYNKIYDIEYNPESQYDGIFMGMEFPPDINEIILEAGRMGMRVGDFNDGTPYLMEPDKDNMVKAEMKVNAFKPYIGAGYNGFIDKKNDRLRFSADCGIMFWGGTPKVYTHDGTEIMGLDNVIGQVRRYTDIVNYFKVFPLLNLSISYRLYK